MTYEYHTSNDRYVIVDLRNVVVSFMYNNQRQKMFTPLTPNLSTLLDGFKRNLYHYMSRL